MEGLANPTALLAQMSNLGSNNDPPHNLSSLTDNHGLTQHSSHDLTDAAPGSSGATSSPVPENCLPDHSNENSSAAQNDKSILTHNASSNDDSEMSPHTLLLKFMSLTSSISTKKQKTEPEIPVQQMREMHYFTIEQHSHIIHQTNK
jgi:hypothetical protein